VMGERDRLRAGIPSRYITSHRCQLSLLPSVGPEMSTAKVRWCAVLWWSKADYCFTYFCFLIIFSVSLSFSYILFCCFIDLRRIKLNIIYIKAGWLIPFVDKRVGGR